MEKYRSLPVGQGAGHWHAFGISWKVAWKSPRPNNAWQTESVGVAGQLKAILVGWREKAEETQRETETDSGIQEGGGRQSSALSSHLSADVDESVLTTQERLRPPQPVYTQTHTCIFYNKGQDRGGREQMRVWVKVNNLVDGVKQGQKLTLECLRKTIKWWKREGGKKGATADERQIDFGKEVERAVGMKKGRDGEAREHEQWWVNEGQPERENDRKREGEMWWRKRLRKTHLVKKRLRGLRRKWKGRQKQKGE